jgi:hypothetical protein
VCAIIILVLYSSKFDTEITSFSLSTLSLSSSDRNAAESMMTGGRMRRDIYQNYWSQFSSICCLNIDNATLQLQTFLADKQRRRIEEGDGMAASDLGDLFHEGGNRSSEWGACGLVRELIAEKAVIRSGEKGGVDNLTDLSTPLIFQRHVFDVCSMVHNNETHTHTRFSPDKYDKIAARIAVSISRFVPKIVQKAGGLLKRPLPPRLPAPATQV